jgi:hypothetical protein
MFFFFSFFLSCTSEVASSPDIIQLSKEEKTTSRDQLRFFSNQKEYFYIVANKKNVLTTLSGNKYIFPEDCFYTTHDSITIEIVEYNDIASIVLKGLTTQCDDEILETAGMVEIAAFNSVDEINREKLRLVKPFRIVYKTELEGDPMQIFFGNMKENIVNWNLAENSEIISNRVMKIDTIYSVSVDEDGNKEYGDKFIDTTWVTPSELLREEIFSIANLGWINCDRFINIEHKVDLSVQIPENEFVTYSLVFKDMNTVLRGARIDRSIVFKGIPKDVDVSFIGFYVSKNKLAYNILDLNTGSSQKEKFVFPDLLNIEFVEFKELLIAKFGSDLANR